MTHTPASTFHQYCTWALTKEKPGLARAQRVDHGIIGLAGEVGEFLDAIKKNMIYEQPYNLAHICEELGDCLFYLTILCACNPDVVEITPVLPYEPTDSLDAVLELVTICERVRISLRVPRVSTSDLRHQLGLIQWLAHEYNLTLVDVMRANQEKLERRYKDGYSNEAAAARADKTEEKGHAS